MSKIKYRQGFCSGIITSVGVYLFILGIFGDDGFVSWIRKCDLSSFWIGIIGIVFLFVGIGWRTEDKKTTLEWSERIKNKNRII